MFPTSCYNDPGLCHGCKPSLPLTLGCEKSAPSNFARSPSRGAHCLVKMYQPLMLASSMSHLKQHPVAHKMFSGANFIECIDKETMALTNQVTTCWHCKRNSKNDVKVLKICFFPVRARGRSVWLPARQLSSPPTTLASSEGGIQGARQSWPPRALNLSNVTVSHFVENESRHDPIGPRELTCTLVMQHRA